VASAAWEGPGPQARFSEANTSGYGIRIVPYQANLVVLSPILRHRFDSLSEVSGKLNGVTV
jgi:hypothetical protein